MGKNLEVVAIRREKVKVLLSMNMTTKEIAVQLGVSERTIWADKNRIRKGWKNFIEKIDIDQLLAEMNSSAVARKKELWKIVKDSKGQIKINAIKNLADEDYRFARFLQSMGIISKSPERFEADVAFTVVSAIPNRTERFNGDGQKRRGEIQVVADEDNEEIKLLESGD